MIFLFFKFAFKLVIQQLCKVNELHNVIHSVSLNPFFFSK